MIVRQSGTYNTNDNTKLSSYNGYVTADIAEFTYTNASVGYDLSNSALNPNIMIDTTDNLNLLLVMLIIVVGFLSSFIFKLFGIGKG